MVYPAMTPAVIRIIQMAYRKPKVIVVPKITKNNTALTEMWGNKYKNYINNFIKIPPESPHIASVAAKVENSTSITSHRLCYC